LVNSSLIIASSIIWGWLIVGLIGLVTLACGIGLFGRSDWAYGLALNMSILNVFVGFIEILGSFNVAYAIRGWVGLGSAIGFGTLILSLVSIYLLFRGEVGDYYEGYWS
jgi:hypothetical protein